MAAASNSTTPQRSIPGNGAHGCGCGLPCSGRAADVQRSRLPAPQARSCSRKVTSEVQNMAHDILIVDDEADIRELVAGILEDEGFGTRTARDSDTAIAEISNRRPNMVFLDIWMQGSKLDGLQLLEHDQAGSCRRAGGDDLRPRQHRNRGRRDQEGRLRFHRKAVQGRSADPGRQPRAGNLAAEARGQGAETAVAGLDDDGRPLAEHEPAAPDRRSRGQGQQPDPDRRPVRRRQGTGRAHAAQRVEPGRRSVCRHQCGGDRARAHGDRAVRGRAVEWRAAAQGRRAGGGAWRHACSSTKSPTCRARRRARFCACWSIRRSSASAAPTRSMSTCASSRRPPATSKPRSPQGRFREDLYHRLSVVPIRVPPLSERREDIPELVEYFMDQISGSTGLPQAQDRRDAMAVLQSHVWPGNVRQLRNNVERLMILAGGEPDATITADMLPQDVGSMVPAMPTGQQRRAHHGTAAARGARGL